ncbi:hypothetical protein [Salicola sp. Rm-C-2C1-2]|uniref:hypothetical protein n=1 Tax=Salicola sp. Rm-C-2C1-2 TaxID=3141321 RepID=UPI0032E3A054
MTTPTESRQQKIIDELRGFIRKVLSEPTVAARCMEIARQHRHDRDAREQIASEISAQTIVRIPETHSEADEIFLDVIDEVLEEEQALY